MNRENIEDAQGFANIYAPFPECRKTIAVFRGGWKVLV